MSKMHNVILPVALLLSALALSACASKEKDAPAAELAPVEAAAAPVVEPEPEPEVAPDPLAETEPAAPVQKVREAKKKVAKPTPPKAAPPPPIVVPPPVVQPEAPAIQPPEPAPSVTVAPLEEKIAEAGFLERYWLWLIVLGIAIAGIVIVRWMSKGEK